jgi:ABC-type antimicrobial peptide transport system permease subunit
MALGATSRQILRMILSIGARQLVIGLAVGLVGAVAITRLMTDLLLGISPNDPIVFTAVPAVLLAVGLLACWLPARRAAALPPTEALRED